MDKNKQKAINYILVLLFCCIGLQSLAQTADTVKEEAATKDLFSHLPKGMNEEVSGDAPEVSLSAEGEKKIELIYLKHYAFTEEHQQRTFFWQYYSGIFLFVMVITIVVMGLILSFKQFQLTTEQVRYNLKTSKEERVIIESGGSTSMEISQTGMKINTAVIGLAILFLSLAFFFLYLKYVYAIEVVNTSS